MELLIRILGWRGDVDLSARWWHRLFKVLYFLLAVPIVAFVLYASVDSASPDHRVENIEVLATLSQAIQQSDPSQNALLVLAGRGEHVGVTRSDGTITKVYDFSIRNSFCSQFPVLAAGEIAAMLNRRNYTSAHTRVTVLNAIAGESGPLCWLDSSLERDMKEATWDQLVAYDLVEAAVRDAKLGAAAKALTWFALLHFVFSNLYYRGVLYVILGPRQRKQARPRSASS